MKEEDRMKRTFLVAIILSALVTWEHIFFDLKTFIPDLAANLAIAVSNFILLLGVIYWIGRKARKMNRTLEMVGRGKVAAVRYIIRLNQNNGHVVV